MIRDRKYETWINHVFKIDKTEFQVGFYNGKEVIISTKYCEYWECRKNENGFFFVVENGLMRPIFDMDKGHLMVEGSRKTVSRDYSRKNIMAFW